MGIFNRIGFDSLWDSLNATNQGNVDLQEDEESESGTVATWPLDSTVRYLGIEMDDALEISEQIDV